VVAKWSWRVGTIGRAPLDRLPQLGIQHVGSSDSVTDSVTDSVADSVADSVRDLWPVARRRDSRLQRSTTETHKQVRPTGLVKPTGSWPTCRTPKPGLARQASSTRTDPRGDRRVHTPPPTSGCDWLRQRSESPWRHVVRPADAVGSLPRTTAPVARRDERTNRIAGGFGSHFGSAFSARGTMRAPPDEVVVAEASSAEESAPSGARASEVRRRSPSATRNVPGVSPGGTPTRASQACSTANTPRRHGGLDTGGVPEDRTR